MNFEADILADMLANPAITGIVGTNIAWDISDGSWQAPYIVCQTVSDDGGTDIGGDPDPSFPLIQFSCWCSTRLAAVTLADVLRKELEGRNIPGDAICSLTYTSRSSTYDPQMRLYGIVLDLRAALQITN